MLSIPLSASLPSQSLYSLRDVTQHFTTGSVTTTILNRVNLDIMPGETLAIMGSSGSGKSSLLHLLGTLAEPVSGSIRFGEQEVTSMTPAQKAKLRNKGLGFVFQYHHMLPEFTTLENVAMQGIIGGMPKEEAFTRAATLLSEVGISDRADHNVTLLSGGERQRAAIARAILNQPKALLADEPTGNLDEKTGRRIAELLLELNKHHKMALIVVTHNPELASYMGRCLELKSGDIYDHTR